MAKALPPGWTVAGHYPGGRNTLNKEVSKMSINSLFIKVTSWILDFGCLFQIFIMEVTSMEYEAIDHFLALYRDLVEQKKARKTKEVRN